MTSNADDRTIHWRMHFASSPEAVYDALATPAGRERFWAESSPETDGTITFGFLGHPPVTGRVLHREAPRRFVLEYFGATHEFTLAADGKGGTDLTLVATGVDASSREEMLAGWVSVLMAMKAAVDHGVDLRNHDPERTWQRGYADN